MIATEQSLTRATVARYAVGSLGTGGFATLPGLVLVYYLTDSLGVAAIVAGVVVTVAKVWDVLIDPVIGARSDRMLAVHGSRRPMMLLGAIALPVFFLLTFAVPPGTAAGAAAVWVLVAFVLTATAFSLFQVPYIALPAELASGYDQRTRLLTWRVVVLTFAILLFGAGGPALRTLGGGNSFAGYLLMALVAGVVIGAGMLVSAFVAPRGLPSGDVPPRASVWATVRSNYAAGVRVLRESQPFRALLLTFLLQGLATGLMLAGANYVATWVLHSEDAVTFLFVALIAPALVVAPLWGVIARRIGKERGFVAASILFAVAALSMVGLLWAPGAWVYAPVAVAGAAYAGMQSLPMAMLPDVISHDARRNGEGRAGTFGGMWTAGETTGMALGATVLSIVLAVSGYVSRSAAVADAAGQPASAVAGIALSFSLVPAAIIAISLVPLARYRLRKGDIDDVL
ncbi:MFS transporter [Leifsonia shinshuensis]|uniref:MFS transporter n=1 Tax=Leifsonia shinshuensis TaxID=150026 RepID=UPI002867A82E|nr:MFS transporter [Leifsonia shinshuensis]MDR6970032.1 Na+/melibiose symporter-like transporter [Leifsonia shinshuensis]